MMLASVGNRVIAWSPIGAGLVLIGQSVVRISGSSGGQIPPWLLATLIGGIGATLVGVDHLLYRSQTDSQSVIPDGTAVIPYGITIISLVVGVSLHLA